MRKVLVGILLIAVFLVGYYAGRQPDSPDILDQCAKAVGKLLGSANQAVADVRQEQGSRHAGR